MENEVIRYVLCARSPFLRPPDGLKELVVSTELDVERARRMHDQIAACYAHGMTDHQRRKFYQDNPFSVRRFYLR